MMILVHVPYVTSYAKDYGCAVTIYGWGYINIILLFQRAIPYGSTSSEGYKIS
jgi:hypothetical protein